VGDPRISVVVPVLNEAGSVETCLRQFESSGDEVEVLVVDGGSADDTRERVIATGAAHLVESPKGRAVQMNAGAAASRGDILLFLHSDSILPEGWETEITEALADDRIAGGRFRLALSEDGLGYRLIEWMSTLRSRFLGITYGDQGIFVRRRAFEGVGGFPDRQIFEDSEFCDALKRLGRFVMVGASLTTSARRWKRWGICRTVLRMWWLRLLYALSVSDEKLSSMYKDVR
tara:strand:+ start:5010 stop:5702 length:693 start_codon:yes stop_codon:yes gene_type:complete